jgi:hypothetical protein
MLNYSVESKSQLAKLLATENIKIEHRNAPTAAFDLKNRTLICPIWKDMSGQMYDLLLGHEVSHALETPFEGWHDAICDKGKNYKHFLNVVEDVRIEKKIKRRYPGIRRSFIGAYKQLLEEDFFGTASKELDDMFFIDRLNIYCKAGVASNIKFNNEEEKSLLKLVEDAETWNDVLYATQKVWEYSKQEQQQELPSQKTYVYQYDENAEYSDVDTSDEDLDEFIEDIYDENDDSKGNSEPVDFDESEKSLEESEESDTSKISHKNDDTNKEEFGDPKCDTDVNFRKNEEKLLSSEVTSYSYINIPKLKSTKMITVSKEINEYMSDFFKKECHGLDLKTLYNKFKSKNEKYISLLAKEFEMRKAAKAHNRSKVASTGDINLSKIYKYQLDDEIFRKATIVPKGKSHGLVLLLDMSGSMSDNIAGSIEQILVLTSFCKKVNIPFKVYGFNSPSLGFDVNECFEQEQNTLQFNTFTLNEFMNSNMKIAEFNSAIKNLCGLAEVYADSRRYYIPPNLRLGRTPLVESVVTLQPLVKDFKKTNNLDIVNLVVVHDGDADNVGFFKSPMMHGNNITSNKNQKFVFRDSKEKLDFPIDVKDYDTGDAIRSSIYKWFTQTTGAKIFGFFITGDAKAKITQALMNQYYDPETGEVPEFEYYHLKHKYYDDLAIKLKKDKFIVSKKSGYEKFFMIVGGKNLQIDDDELTVVGKVTASKLFNSLRKVTKNKSTNRVLASQFIQGIAV